MPCPRASSRHAIGRAARLRLGAALATLLLFALARPGALLGQPPPPTPSPAPASATAPIAPTATPSPTLEPVPWIAGTWSITRSWYRRCPGCAAPVTLSSTWRIQQDGFAVRVERGPAGGILPDGAGGGYLALEGPESAGPLTLRLYYAGLRVAPDGAFFEGTMNGSEQRDNPCGDRPPIVSCFVSAGWIQGRRLEAAPSPTLAPAPSPTPSPSPPPTLSPTPGGATPGATPPSSTPPPPTASPSASATLPAPSPSPRPPDRRLWLPVAERGG